MKKVLGTVGAVALGAAVMYVLDPKSGKRRRAMIKDKAVSIAHKESEMVARTAREFRDRVKGASHKVSEAIGQATADTGRLADPQK
jgi:gas vesicle protein